MKLVKQSWQFETDLTAPEQSLKLLEKAGRLCYQTVGTEDSYEDFLAKRIKIGHESLIEHVNITVKIITDRGVTHELVRHRLGSYSQESTRYCNYGKLGMKFIFPVDFELTEDDLHLLNLIEAHYNTCLNSGRTPQQARYFLPNGLKTEIIVTFNLREWRHFFNLRCSKGAHPQMRALALDMLNQFYAKFPVIFQDIHDKYLLGDK
jgi:thymidylate synthase (FAD)